MSTEPRRLGRLVHHREPLFPNVFKLDIIGIQRGARPQAVRATTTSTRPPSGFNRSAVTSGNMTSLPTKTCRASTARI